MKGKKFVNFSISMNPDLLEAIDAFIANQAFESRSSFLREAAREKLERAGYLVGTWLNVKKLKELYKEFDAKYVEVWRQPEEVAKLINEIEELEAELPEQSLRTLEEFKDKHCKLWEDAIAQLKGTKFQMTVGRARMLMELKNRRTIERLRGNDTTYLDNLIELIESHTMARWQRGEEEHTSAQ